MIAILGLLGNYDAGCLAHSCIPPPSAQLYIEPTFIHEEELTSCVSQLVECACPLDPHAHSFLGVPFWSANATLLHVMSIFLKIAEIVVRESVLVMCVRFHLAFHTVWLEGSETILGSP